jgi:hypothetical protein
MPTLIAVFLLGLVGGMRSFTTLAVYWFMRRGGVVAYPIGVAACVEYGLDIHPRAQARTGVVGLTARFAVSAFLGWTIAAGAGTAPWLGALISGVAAIIGAHVSLLLRTRAIAAIGNVPSGLIEDVIAIVLSVLIISRI